MSRSVYQVRAEAISVRRLRIERWLSKRLADEAQRLANVAPDNSNNAFTWELRGRIHLLVELIETLREGREQ